MKKHPIEHIISKAARSRTDTCSSLNPPEALCLDELCCETKQVHSLNTISERLGEFTDGRAYFHLRGAV